MACATAPSTSPVTPVEGSGGVVAAGLLPGGGNNDVEARGRSDRVTAACVWRTIHRWVASGPIAAA
eukprot:scaffold15599_cov129-Skeletonema_dohrnii-CCMP3373.AAC.14